MPAYPIHLRTYPIYRTRYALGLRLSTAFIHTPHSHPLLRRLGDPRRRPRRRQVDGSVLDHLGHVDAAILRRQRVGIDLPGAPPQPQPSRPLLSPTSSAPRPRAPSHSILALTFAPRPRAPSQGRGVDYGAWLLKGVDAVTVADALHALKKYIVPLFDPSANIAVTCPTNKLDECCDGHRRALKETDSGCESFPQTCSFACAELFTYGCE